ncbi:hypothetical protein C8R45DRAFT_975695 [Mycena sanguinolenta]|nr:hypothetical protein C8R45DRAFT_975695 [Mycena sanguinolenta]
MDDDVDTLPGPIIRVLWSRSRLPLPVLSAIWNECDPGRTGALDREAFVRGCGALTRNSDGPSRIGRRTRTGAGGGVCG